MKKTRSLPYGYEMRGGEIKVAEKEARVLRRIYRMYERGSSLNSIANAFEKEGVPYSAAVSTWNKHKVKRILENPRYSGENGLPAILDRNTLERVRELYTRRTQAWQAPVEAPQKYIWKRLVCAECGGVLTRIGTRGKKDTLLKCDGCGLRMRFETEALLQTLTEHLKEATTPSQMPSEYQPTQELMRLENEIERRAEKPSDGKMTRRMILAAAAMRYSLCHDPKQEEPDIAEGEAVWHLFKNTVEAVLISGAGEIHLRLKSERT